jgi:hypothetical protein
MVRDPPETRLSRIHRDSLLTSACLLAQRLEIELLKKNIQPHFLLNTLTVLIEVIEQAPATAVKLIEAVATTSMPLTTPGGWRSGTRSAQFVEEAGRKFVRVGPALGEGVVWLEGSDLRNGTIEVEMRGSNVQGQSFVGLAFRGIDDMTYDAVYFRPFNFKAEDSERVLRAVQYHSNPNFPWAKLRTDSPNMYEKPVSPAPDPDSWFRAKIVIEERAVNAYVNDSKSPTLSVTALSEPRAGMVGLWLGNASPGDFANLTLTPRRP